MQASQSSVLMSEGDVGCFLHLRVKDSSVVRIAMLMLYAVKSSLFGHSSFLRRFSGFSGFRRILEETGGLGISKTVFRFRSWILSKRTSCGHSSLPVCFEELVNNQLGIFEAVHSNSIVSWMIQHSFLIWCRLLPCGWPTRWRERPLHADH